MTDRRFAWATYGIVFAGLWLAPVECAYAQTPSQILPPASSGGEFPAASGVRRPSSAPQPGNSRAAAETIDDADTAPQISPPIPQSDPSQDSAEQDGHDEPPKSGQQGGAADGDLDLPGESLGLKDGLLDSDERQMPEDGTDASIGDTRDSEGFELIQNPPAGFDPLLFQIEDLDPLSDNRAVRRLFEQQPYDPVGIKIGSFVLFPEVGLGTSYYSNVFHAPGSPGDVAFDVLPAARLVSNWSRHALEFRAAGTVSFYDQFAPENDKDYVLEARGRLDITSRANVQALVSRTQALEDRSALDASSAGTRAETLTDRFEASYNQRFNRLSLQLRGSITGYSIGDTQNGGVVTLNNDRDYTAYEEVGRASWELKPSLSPYFEVATNQRNYGEAAQTDLINRTSTGQRYRAGLSFGNAGEILRGEISLGYGVQTPDDARLHPVDGLILDANATWRVTKLTSLLFNATSDVSETTTANVGGAFYRSVGVEVRHQFKSYLVASAGLLYANQNSLDGIIDDHDLRETLGLQYYADRNTVLFGTYTHINFDGVGAPSDYVGDEVHIGVTLRR